MFDISFNKFIPPVGNHRCGTHRTSEKLWVQKHEHITH